MLMAIGPGASPNDATVPIYEILFPGIVDGGLRHFSSAQARIWRAIDELRAEAEGSEEIRLLEEMSIELHAMQQDVRDGFAPLQHRARVAALADRWMNHAILCR